MIVLTIVRIVRMIVRTITLITLTISLISLAIVSADALDTQDDTARIVLEQGGDYVLQVKANQRSVKRQCETISRIRPLVGTSKKS